MASSNYNESHVFYEGPNNREMPRLVADGRIPISPSQLYWKRLGTLNNYLSAVRRDDKRGIQFWKGEMAKYWDQRIDTGFGVARHPDQGIILVPNAEIIKGLNLGTPLSAEDRYAVLEDGTFESLKGKGHHYSDNQVTKYGSHWLTMKEALKSPFWADFILDNGIREFAIRVTYEQFKERFPEEFKKNNKLMGVFPPEATGKEIMGLFSFRRLEDWSNAVGRSHVDGSDGRLVGVFPDVAEGDAQNLEDILIKYPELRKAA